MTINDKLKDLAKLAERFNQELNNKSRIILDVETSLRDANIHFPIEVHISTDIETEICTQTAHTIQKSYIWQFVWKKSEEQQKYRVFLEEILKKQTFYSKDDVTNCSEISTTETLSSNIFAETNLETRLEFYPYVNIIIDEVYDTLAAKLHSLEEDNFNNQ